MSSGLALVVEGGRWKRYPAYRDSGVEWLGKVPEHWEMLALKRLASLKSGESITVESIDKDGDYPVFGGNGLRGYTTTFTHDGNYVLIGRQGALCGNINYAQGKFWASEHAVVVSPIRPVETKWLGELLRAMNLNRYSVSAAQPGLSAEMVSNLSIPHPPLQEQSAIAAFLDRETGRIDALIVKKERQIGLLQEKRTALISHAVTKGLDPDAPMKDSRVEWLGEVPERWGVKQFKRVTTRVDVGIAEAATHAYADKGVPIIRSTNVRPGRILMDDLLYIHEWFAEKNRSKYLFANDLLTVRTGAPGTTAVIPPELHECQCFTMLISTLKTRQIPQFYSYFLNSSNARFRFAVEGWGTAQINISVPILQQQIIAEPPENEQRAITTFLNHETMRIDVLTTKVRESITKLREYRTALISAAVTGKIDVREELVS